jgi:hypothetical protein
MKKSRFVGRQKGIQTVYMGVKQVDGGGGGTPSWFAQAKERKDGKKRTKDTRSGIYRKWR